MKLKEAPYDKLSPMMKQYYDIKIKNMSYIIFFRLGDFYEMFFDDALIISKELELTLTGRDCGLGERVPMCGIPFHSSENYVKRLLEKGYKVAICEQMEDPASVKGIVARDIVKVVTPGTITETSLLDDTSNNYIASVYCKGNVFSMCFADISTGEVCFFQGEDKFIEDKIISELSRFSPVEILISKDLLSMKNVATFIKTQLATSLTLLEDEEFDSQGDLDVILSQFSAEDLSEIGLDAEFMDLSSVYSLFFYIRETQRNTLNRFTKISVNDTETVMKLGLTARRNLELCEKLQNKEKKGTLLWVLDKTYTSMGKRLLKNIIEQPLIAPAKIIDRHNAVEEIIANPILHAKITECLKSIYDLERLMTKVIYKSANPRDLKALSTTALKLPHLKEILSLFSSKLLKGTNEKISSLEEISNLIENAIIDEPPVSLKDGGVIKEGFNEELDELTHIVKNGKGIIDKIENDEREKTGIKNLKIGFNRVFGYYIEVTKSYYSLVPDTYIRKQTLANCERFITNELKTAENSISGASERIVNLESEIFTEIRDYIATLLVKVSETATSVALVDVLNSFANVAVNNNYVKPDVAIDGIIEIKNGRHPVVELMLEGEDVFVPNDAYLDLNHNKMLILTGPNMSGKSTYMRQIALITLMAQIGSFIPCESGRISVVDQIFTRVGASDDLTAGQSTFMVEMSEVADIVKNATKNSLVILDEVGRGTSTFDGLSIAQSVCEFIATNKNLGCKTLFATHYHELIDLEDKFQGVKNYSVAVAKKENGIKFLRKIVPGGVDESYGIEVAKLAGLPKKIISRANELLIQLENEHAINLNKSAENKEKSQISFEKIGEKTLREKLLKTNVDELSDSEAKIFLRELIDML